MVVSSFFFLILFSQCTFSPLYFSSRIFTLLSPTLSFCFLPPLFSNFLTTFAVLFQSPLSLCLSHNAFSFLTYNFLLQFLPHSLYFSLHLIFLPLFHPLLSISSRHFLFLLSVRLSYSTFYFLTPLHTCLLSHSSPLTFSFYFVTHFLFLLHYFLTLLTLFTFPFSFLPLSFFGLHFLFLLSLHFDTLLSLHFHSTFLTIFSLCFSLHFLLINYYFLHPLSLSIFNHSFLTLFFHSTSLFTFSPLPHTFSHFSLKIENNY